MRQLCFAVCAVFVFACASSSVEARELSAACAAKKAEVEQRAKEAYQRWDTGLYEELTEEVRQIERFCTDEKLLKQVDSRHARQQKYIFSLQQSLEKASEERKNQEWIDKQTAKLREANKTLRGIEEERNALLAGMGKTAPAPAISATEGEIPAVQAEPLPELLSEPLAVDNPAYNQ